MDIAKAIRVHLDRHVKTYPGMLVDQLTLVAQDYACSQADSLVGEILQNAGDEWDRDEAGEAIAVRYVRHLEAIADAAPVPGEGRWLSIAFLGHVELTGYVTEITLGGQAAFRVELPEKLWGGNPDAWEEYAASALYSRRPVTEESVRRAWEARQRAVRERERREAGWVRAEAQRALEAGSGDDAWGGSQEPGEAGAF
jgi:hypothetical protein